MARGKKLTGEETVGILNLKEGGSLSIREIAREIDRSESVVRHFLQNVDNYGKNYS